MCHHGKSKKQCFLKKISESKKLSCADLVCEKISNCTLTPSGSLNECQCQTNDKVEKCFLDAKTRTKKVRNSKKNKQDETINKKSNTKKTNSSKQHQASSSGDSKKVTKLYKETQVLVKSNTAKTKLPKVDRLTKRTTSATTTVKN